MNQTIGKRIQTLRKQHGMSQQDLSDKLNISRQTISKWESDQTLPDLTTLIKMSEIFNVSIAFIVGVEEDNKSISQMYKLMQTVLNNQQKQNKTRNIIQTITIFLCILSLGLNISMKHEMSTKQKMIEETDVMTTPFSTAYAFTKDLYTIIIDNPYLMSESRIDVIYYDLNDMMVNIKGDFYLSEYNQDTKANLEVTSYLSDHTQTIKLDHKEDNHFTFNKKLELDNYKKIVLKIDDGNGNIRSTDITDSVPHNYFDHVLFNQINLFIEGQPSQIVFDPTYYNTASDNRFMGYLDGYLKIRFYTTNKHYPLEEFTVSLDKKVILELKEDLPLNTPIYFDMNYVVENPNNKDSFSGYLGKMVENDGEINYYSFIIPNKTDRVRIFQTPIAYVEELDTYFFSD